MEAYPYVYRPTIRLPEYHLRRNIRQRSSDRPLAIDELEVHRTDHPIAPVFLRRVDAPPEITNLDLPVHPYD
jgi:hypothetical protein